MTQTQLQDSHQSGSTVQSPMINDLVITVVKGTTLAAVGPVRFDCLAPPLTLAYVQTDAPLSDKLSSPGHSPQVLINKLAQRLAFERAGVSLYEALIIKCEAAQEQGGHSILSIQKLRQFRDEELAHFLLLKKAMITIGADPAVMTPDTSAGALTFLGVQQVLGEPHSSVLQCLKAILTTELTDNAAWGLLKELCLNMELQDLANEFTQALAQEEAHAEIIAEWVRLMTLAMTRIPTRTRKTRTTRSINY